MAERDDKILHEADVEAVIDEELEDVSTHAAIADLAAPSSTYVEAEALAQRNATNAILAVLRDAKLIPTT
jgi:BarA-like signal transduction histidine kinase